MASILLVALISYLAGIRGIALFFATMILYIPIYLAAGFITYYFRPRFVKHTPKYGDVDFRLTGPPGSSNNTC